MHFCYIFGLSKLLTRRENISLNGIIIQEFGSQKGITGQELGSQISLLDMLPKPITFDLSLVST